MIIDRESFTDIANHLERASSGILAAASGLTHISPQENSQHDPATIKWLALVDALQTVNVEITALESILRGVLEANCEERGIAVGSNSATRKLC